MIPTPSQAARVPRGVLVVLATVALTVAAGGLPARADTPVVTVDQPAANGAAVTSEPASYSGHVVVNGGVIDDVSVQISSPDGHPGGTKGFPGVAGTSETFEGAVTLDYNGKYVITATATGHDVPPDSFGRQTVSATRTFVMSVAPAAPTGVSTQFDGQARTVTIAWAANPEPDIYGYLVQRRDPNSGSYAQVGGVVPTTSFTDTSVATAAAGDYSYQVIADRHGADATSFVPSGPSSAATASVSGPPVTSSTTTPPTTTVGPSTTLPGGSTTTAVGGGPGGAGGSTTTVVGGAGGHPVTGHNGKPPPVASLTPPARASAGDFGALLAQARASTATTQPPDTGFSPRLPFSARSSQQLVNVPGSGELAGSPLLSGDGENRRRLTFEYVAGALVLLVLAMHALFLKRQVDQAGPLEVIDLGALAAEGLFVPPLTVLPAGPSPPI